MQTTLALLSAAFVLTGPPAGGAPLSSQRGVELNDCVVKLIYDVPVPAEAAGLLVAMDVKEGDSVEEGGSLGQIHDADAQLQLKAAEAELAVAKAQAENNINERFAEASRDVAQAELDMSEYVNKQEENTISEAQLRAERLALTKAGLQIEVAKLDLKVAELNSQVNAARVEAAKEEIERRRINALWPGKVEQVLKHAGEWVNPGDPVLRLVRMDRLRVEGMLKVAELSPSQVAGHRVLIEVDLPYGVERFEGVIDFVASAVNVMGDEYKVWAEVVNRKRNNHWVLMDNLGARMTILLD